MYTEKLTHLQVVSRKIAEDLQGVADGCFFPNTPYRLSTLGVVIDTLKWFSWSDTARIDVADTMYFVQRLLDLVIDSSGGYFSAYTIERIKECEEPLQAAYDDYLEG